MSTVSGKASRRRRLNKAKRANVVFWVSVCSVLAAVLGAGIWAWQTDAPARIIETIVGALDDAATAAGLTVADVTLSGRDHAARAELIAALGVARGENMLRIDPGAVRARLENLGWVEKAAVARRLPGQIRIHITERRPFALWQRDGALFLIDRAGVVVTDHDLDAFADLPVIVGGEAAARAGDLMDMLAAEPALFARVRAAVRVGGRRWDVHLDNDVVVRLPEIDAGRAWQRLAAVEAEHGIVDRDLTTIDLRLPDRLVVRLDAAAALRLGAPAEDA